MLLTIEKIVQHATKYRQELSGLMCVTPYYAYGGIKPAKQLPTLFSDYVVSKKMPMTMGGKCCVCGKTRELEYHEVLKVDDTRKGLRFTKVVNTCKLCHSIIHFENIEYQKYNTSGRFNKRQDKNELYTALQDVFKKPKDPKYNRILMGIQKPDNSPGYLCFSLSTDYICTLDFKDRQVWAWYQVKQAEDFLIKNNCRLLFDGD